MPLLAVLVLLLFSGCHESVNHVELAIGRNVIILDPAGRPCCSGVLLSPRYVLTASHCVNAEPTVKIKWRNAAGDEKIIRATVLYADPDQESTDLAILELDEPIEYPDAVLYSGRSPPRMLELIFAVGNPHGVIDYTASDGKVVYVDRKTNVGTYDQISCIIFRGNSGGGVYTYNGELVGIIVRGGSLSHTYMIPARTIREWMTDYSLD